MTSLHVTFHDMTSPDRITSPDVASLHRRHDLTRPTTSLVTSKQVTLPPWRVATVERQQARLHNELGVGIAVVGRSCRARSQGELFPVSIVLFP